MTHIERLRSISAHFAYFCNLFIYGWIFCILSIIIAKLSAYVVVAHVEENVLKLYGLKCMG
jgi:hypothetical protein